MDELPDAEEMIEQLGGFALCALQFASACLLVGIFAEILISQLH